MYLKIRDETYEKLIQEANENGMSLAGYINQILEKKLLQQGSQNGRERTARKRTSQTVGY